MFFLNFPLIYFSVELGRANNWGQRKTRSREKDIPAAPAAATAISSTLSRRVTHIAPGKPRSTLSFPLAVIDSHICMALWL